MKTSTRFSQINNLPRQQGGQYDTMKPSAHFKDVNAAQTTSFPPVSVKPLPPSKQQDGQQQPRAKLFQTVDMDVNSCPYKWDCFIYSESKLPGDYYFDKLMQQFVTKNPDRFKLGRTKNEIVIKEFGEVLFSCDRSNFEWQLNLYLEFFECGFQVVRWKDTFLCGGAKSVI